MGYTTTGSSRASAKSAVASSIVVANSDTGFKLSGSSVSAQTPFAAEVISPGQTSVVATVKSTAITNVIVTDSSYNNLDDTDINNATGGYAKIIGFGFLVGATVYLNGTAVTATFVSSTEIRITVPPTTSGTYGLMLFNPTGDGAIYLNLQFSSAPSFSTAAGTLGNVYEFNSTSTNISASGDTPLTYSLFSGSLPPGVTLSSSGVLSGTTTATNVSSTYSFVIKVEDPDLQETTRSFSLTIVPDVVTWVTPAIDSTISIAGGSNYSTNLSAISAAGKTVAYQASNLPEGIALNNGILSGAYTGTNTTETSTLTAVAADTLKQAVSTITWSISFGDIYFKNVTTVISAADPTTSVFVDDASTNNFPVTIVGDTKPNNFNPYTPGYYSTYFDGTGDFLTIPGNVAFNLSSGSWTVECWFYQTSSKEVQIISSGAARWRISINTSQQVGWLFNTSSVQTSNNTAPLNKWNHVAVCYNGTTCVMYLNGVAQTATGALAPASDNASVLYIGRNPDASGAWDFNGYISNARIVKGTAVYTANFTPPTQPLTAISGTTLLTCQSNRFIDNSTNNFTITLAGNVTVSSFDPFVPSSSTATLGSTYFDGTGDYLTVPTNAALNITSGSTDSFSCELWVNFTTVGASRSIIDNGGLSGTSFSNWAIYLNASSQITTTWGNSAAPGTSAIGTLTSSTVPVVGQWYHIALVKTNADWSLFINGIRAVTVNGLNTAAKSSATALYIGFGIIGAGFAGYISNVRIYNGITASAPYSATSTTFTPSTQPLTAIAGTVLLTCQTNQPVNNNVFIDSSTNNFLITRNGNATQGTFSPYGENWSNYFDGAGDQLTVANNAAFNFGTGDFTVECWFNISANSTANTDGVRHGALFGPGQLVNAAAWVLELTGNSTTTGVALAFQSRASNATPTTLSYSFTFEKNTWYHAAVSKVGNTLAIFVNGQKVVENTNWTVLTNSGGSLFRIGRRAVSASYEHYFNGYISNIRVVKGTGLYTTNFTPSTTPLLPIAGTSLLTCQSPNIVDDSANRFAITRTGDVRVEKFGPFAGTTLPTPYYSAYFDGAGDYITTAVNTAFDMGTGDFTIECFTISNGYSGSQYGRGLWVLYTAGNYNNRILVRHSSAGQILGIYGNTGSTTYFGTSGTGGTTNLVVGQWYHVAFVRQSGVFRLYVNGVQEIVVSNQTGISLAGLNCFDIGRCQDGSTPDWNGYISNFRAIKGTCLYPDGTTFTPSTQPLTAITNTSLLTCQSNTFRDNSTNNFAITAAGNTVPSQFAPFAVTYSTGQSYTPAVFGGSMYFDGNGDRLAIPYTTALSQQTAYTLEFWFYPTYNFTGQYLFARNAGGYFGIAWNGTSGILTIDKHGVGIQITGTTALPLNAWHHVAMTYDGTTTRLFANGILQGSVAGTGGEASGSTTVGYYESSASTSYGGYMSNLRMVRGTALYTSNFVPQNIPLTPVTNTTLLVNGTNAGVCDSSGMNNYETIGDAKIDTTVVKFAGTNSVKFDGTEDYLVTPPSMIYANLWTGNLTVECWVYFNSVANAPHIWSIGESSTVRCTLYVAGSVLKFYTVVGAGGDRITSSTTLATGQWYHVALTKSNGVFTLWLNGVSQGTSNTTVFPSGLAETVAIGFQNYGGQSGDYFNGYISDFRITNGTARYTTNFTPPTAAHSTK